MRSAAGAVALLFATATTAATAPTCGMTDGTFRVYQVVVKDFEAAKAGLSKSFAFARSQRTGITCEAYDWPDEPGPFDERHFETRWIPKQGRLKFEGELKALGELRISQNKGHDETYVPPTPGELKKFKEEAAAERDPVARRKFEDKIARVEEWIEQQHAVRTFDLVQVRLVRLGKDRPPYVPPEPGSFLVTPETVRLSPAALGAEELRRSTDWFSKRED